MGRVPWATRTLQETVSKLGKMESSLLTEGAWVLDSEPS